MKLALEAAMVNGAPVETQGAKGRWKGGKDGGDSPLKYT
jgi:hypothetical protein